MTAYRFFSVKKCSSYNTSSVTSLKQVKQHSELMIRCQSSIVTVNVRSVHRQLQAPTQAVSHLI